MSLTNNNRGFTLIELLVVIFIISIVAGVALISIGQSQSSKVQAFAKQVTETLLLAQQQAMLQPVVLGVYLDERNIQFLDLSSQPGRQPLWRKRQDKLLGVLEVPDQLTVKLSQADEQPDVQANSKAINPQIVISTNGDLTPFTLYLGLRDEKPRFVIRGDVDGSITRQNLF
jgi:general secretion pathway protein H